MNEIWASIIGFDGHYEASNTGKIRVKPRVIIRKHSRTGELKEYSYAGKELIQSVGVGGYYRVTMGFSGKTINRTVHTLVANAFLGERKNGLVVCHNNGICTDNRLENLRYATLLENAQDRKKHGNYPNCEKHPMAKFSRETIMLIREGKLNCKQSGVSRTHFHRIKNNESWKSA